MARLHQFLGNLSEMPHPTPTGSEALGMGCKGKPYPVFPYSMCFACLFLLLTQNTPLLTLLVTTRVGIFLHSKQFCGTSLVSRNVMQFWCCLPGDRVGSHWLRTQFSTTASTHFRCQLQVVGFRLPTTSVWSDDKAGSHNPSSGSIHLLELLTELWDTLTWTSLLKDVIKDTDGQPGEEIHWVRSGKVPGVGASVPVELGALSLQGECVCPPGSSLNSTLGIFKGFSSGRAWSIMNSIFNPFLFSREWGWGLKF